MRLWNQKDRLCLSNELQGPYVYVWSLKMEDSSEKWEKKFVYKYFKVSIGRFDTNFRMLDSS